MKIISQRLFDALVILSGLGGFAAVLIASDFVNIQGLGEGVIAAIGGIGTAWYVNNRLKKELSEGEAFIRSNEASKFVTPPPE